MIGLHCFVSSQNVVSANVSHKTPEDAHLPPELRKAGLMAHIAISKGKCFGPFKGRITNKRKPPGKMHFLVSQVKAGKGTELGVGRGWDELLDMGEGSGKFSRIYSFFGLL